MNQPGRARRMRVLVVDDSLLTCRLLTDALHADPELAVVGWAHNGLQANRMVAELRPDLVTMDVDMPVLDGFEAVRSIMGATPVPILVVTEMPLHGRGLVGRMLSAGALEVFSKPQASSPVVRQREYAALRERARALARIRLRGQVADSRPEAPGPLRPAARRAEIVAVVASTGGPAALERLLRDLPADLGCAVVLVQHIAQGFVEDLAEWLNQVTPLEVHVAAQGEVLAPGTALLAPDGHHLQVSAARVRLSDDPPELGLRPSGNRLLRSVAHSFGPRGVGVILTGMGRDGAEGLAALKAAGGLGLAQDEGSSSIFGMPRAAIEAGGVQEVLSLRGIAVRLRSVATRRAAQGVQG